MSDLRGQPHSCFVCDSSVLEIPNELSQKTRFSETSVFVLLEQFVGHQLPRTDTDIWCNECITKIDHYDQAITTAKQVQTELLLLFTTTVNNYTENAAEEFKTSQTASDIVIMNESFSADDPENLSDYTGNVAEDDALESSDQSNAENNQVSAEENDVDLVDDEDDDDNDDDDEEYKLPVHQQVKNLPKKRGRPRKVEKPTSFENKVATHIRTTQKRQYKVGPPFKCDICDLKFEIRSDYKAHVKTHNTPNASPLICDVCGQTYKSKVALEVHVNMHKGVCPHKCEICSKQFTQRGALMRHMPLHTGERPYQCDKCGKQFIHYSSFHMHQLAHDNIREKKCDVCGMELRSNSHLTRHMRVHSGEKPYSCPTCGQRFAQRYNMMTHYKAHQGIHRVNTKSFPCPICQVVLPKQTKLNEHLSVHHGSIQSSFKSENLEKYRNALPVTAASASQSDATNDRLNSSSTMSLLTDSTMVNISITTADPRSVNIKKEKSFNEVFE